MNLNFVTVDTYRSLPEAEAARLFLESEGLQPILVDVEMVAMDWLLSDAIGNIKLQVPTKEKDVAEKLLRDLRIRRHKRLEQGDDGDEQTTCLSCGALLPENVSQCTHCGWSYGDDGETDDGNPSES